MAEQRASAYTTDAKPDVQDEDEGVMDHEMIQSIIASEMADAISYRDTDVAPRRTEATKYYRGDIDILPNEEGRSTAISMDERDTVMAILPSLVRIFLGSERAVELIPDGPDSEAGARQRTDYLDLILREEPRHFHHLYGAMKDALLRTPGGVIKWWWDMSTEVQYETYAGLLEDQVTVLASADDVEDVSYEVDGDVELPTEGLDAGAEMGQDPAQPATPGRVKTFTVRLKRKTTKGRMAYGLIPGEELLWNREATWFGDARIITHRRAVSRSDLIAMGYDAKVLEEHEGNGSFAFLADQEFLDRRPANQMGEGQVINPALERTLYCEHLTYLDRDRDGIAELTKVCTLGEGYFVVKVEDAPEINYALFEMDPESGEMGGLNVHDVLRDITRIKSAVLRAVLDSLRASTDPRIAAFEDFVNFDDLLNPEIGGVVRTSGDPNMVLRVLDMPFLGQPAMGVLEYLDTLKESRTGATRGSQGLNAEHMQSTTAMAIGAQLSAAQQRIEMIARVLAETGFKTLYMGIQKTLMRHQNVERTVRLRGAWETVDPRTWEAAMDIQVNVGLGAGTPADKIQFLQGVLQKQEQVLQLVGPSPLVDYHLYAETLIKAAEVGGYTDGTRFFGRVPKGWAPPPAPEKPDPAMLLAQIEKQKVETQLEIEKLKLVQQREAAALKTETDRMKIEADMQVKILELELKFNAQIEEAKVQHAIETVRSSTEAAIRAHEAEVEQATRAHEAETAAQAQMQAAQAAAPPGGSA